MTHRLSSAADRWFEQDHTQAQNRIRKFKISKITKDMKAFCLTLKMEDLSAGASKTRMLRRGHDKILQSVPCASIPTKLSEHRSLKPSSLLPRFVGEVSSRCLRKGVYYSYCFEYFWRSYNEPTLHISLSCRNIVCCRAL